jgi:hypothetical protein
VSPRDVPINQVQSALALNGAILDIPLDTAVWHSVATAGSTIGGVA